uniref:Uncharacterized protein n=2 Tax=Canis lupus TaxID=9612 RepID=A0A8C0THE9_CANLF
MWQNCLLKLNIRLNSVVLGIKNSCNILIVSFDVPWAFSNPTAAYHFILQNPLLYMFHPRTFINRKELGLLSFAHSLVKDP